MQSPLFFFVRAKQYVYCDSSGAERVSQRVSVEQLRSQYCTLENAFGIADV